MAGKHPSEKTNKGFLKTGITVILALAVGLGIGLLLRGNESPVSVSALFEKQETEEPVEKNTDSISIPGYEILRFKAGQTEQKLAFPNPEQNFCYFKISLCLPDGTLIWQSDLIEPGDVSDSVVLTQSFDSASYADSVLHYDCYTMDGTMTPLNSAETKLTINFE